MKTYLIGFLMAALALSSQALALENSDSSNEMGGIYADLGGGSDPDVIGAKMGLFGYMHNHLSMHGGIACLASEKFDDIFVGADGGFRLHLLKPEARVSPFVGMGLFGGYTKKNVSAEDDDIDNDDDGEIDEEGEEKRVIDNVMGLVYPEIGLRIRLAEDSRMILSGRYNLTTEGRESDFWLFSLGFEWLFGEVFP
jgi:hypothetical protein